MIRSSNPSQARTLSAAVLVTMCFGCGGSFPAEATNDEAIDSDALSGDNLVSDRIRITCAPAVGRLGFRLQSLSSEPLWVTYRYFNGATALPSPFGQRIEPYSIGGQTAELTGAIDPNNRQLTYVDIVATQACPDTCASTGVPRLFAVDLTVTSISDPACTIGLPGGPTGSNAPTLIEPADGATGVVVFPTLTWNASIGATSYRVQVSTSPAFDSTVRDLSNIAATWTTLTALENNTTYYWRVSATTTNVPSAWSTSRSFTTPAGPATPSLSSPANFASGVELNPTLAWNATYGAATYAVEISSSPYFFSFSSVLYQGGLTSTSLPVAGLLPNRTYYWRVTAWGPGLVSGRLSPTWVFTTAP